MIDVVYVLALAAVIVGVSLLVYALVGLLPGIGAGLIVAGVLAWLIARNVDSDDESPIS